MKRLIQFLEQHPILGAICAALLIVPSVSLVAYSAVTQISGLAAAGPNNSWYNVKDSGKFANPQTSGILAVGQWLFTGTNFVKQAGNVNGAATVSQEPSGTAFFAVKRDNITTASVNLAYGFTSKKISISAPITNTDDVCIDWIGGTAVCPAANTSGDGRLAPGDSYILDDYAQTSISVIAASGTQIVSVQAWN